MMKLNMPNPDDVATADRLASHGFGVAFLKRDHNHNPNTTRVLFTVEDKEWDIIQLKETGPQCVCDVFNAARGDGTSQGIFNDSKLVIDISWHQHSPSGWDVAAIEQEAQTVLNQVRCFSRVILIGDDGYSRRLVPQLSFTDFYCMCKDHLTDCHVFDNGFESDYAYETFYALRDVYEQYVGDTDGRLEYISGSVVYDRLSGEVTGYSSAPDFNLLEKGKPVKATA
ncbi:MAG: hypothetical protein LBM21_00835 [Coriobacteriales bacterium]|jgi:hypothetical protein|nr:hypothetical protein [Coriobacteriales bacterium]